MTTVYVDSVFVLNALMDYLLLLCTGRLAGVPLRRGRYALAAVLGGAWTFSMVGPWSPTVGNTVLTAVFMPGHTPGQMIFYIADKKIMFLGDHLLFDITPNITEWPEVDNSLKHYMHNLERLLDFDIELPLPAHRNLSNKTLEDRVAEILAHHAVRLNQILQMLKEHPGSSAYEIAGGLTWSMRGRSWKDAPNRQKWFAVGETLAHIEYLIADNKIRRTEKESNGKMIHAYELV